MSAKRCHACGKPNPRYFTHCVACGAKLADETKKNEKWYALVKTGLILVLSLLIIIFVILPAVQYSATFGRNFSETVAEKSATDLQPVPEYPLGQPVTWNELEITVLSARDGQNTYNSNKFFIAVVSMKNLKTSGNTLLSSNDFELVDTDGTRYVPYGIASKVMYDLSPSESSSADLTFVIPQKARAAKIQFTFPKHSALTDSRNTVAFVI